MSGYLKITFGSMFSGKSSDLIKDAHEYVDVMNKTVEEVYFKAVIINHESDERNISKVGVISSHSTCGKIPSDKIKMIKSSNLFDVYDLIKDSTYVAIDECQFFDNLEEFVKKLVKEGKYVHCCGLISDTNMEKFGKLTDLIHFADTVVQNKAFCIECLKEDSFHQGTNASFNKWIGPKNKDDKIVVGDKLYASVCRKHF